MNERIRKLAEQAHLYNADDNFLTAALEEFAELLLRNLAEELADVAKGSKKINPEWANGVDHAAMLAQRMTMNLPQWPDAE